jgi:hypothetical protein
MAVTKMTGMSRVASHVGHHDVQQDQVGLLGLRELDRLDAVLGEQQSVVGLQDLPQHLQVGGLVVGDQQRRATSLCDVRHGAWPPWRRGLR